MPPPVQTSYRDGQYVNEPVGMDFAAPVAPGGEPWPEFMDKAYQGVVWAQSHDESVEPNPYAAYAVYWNPLIQSLQGHDYGYNATTGARQTTASPEFTQAVAQLPDAFRAQAGENLAAQGREDAFSIFGDQFFQALAALGAATGLAGAYGAFGAAPAAGGLGSGELGLETTFGSGGSTLAGGAGGDALALGGGAGGVGGTGAGLGGAGVGAADIGGSAFPLAAMPGTLAPAGVPTAVAGGVGAGVLGGAGGMGSWGSLIGPAIQAGGAIAGGVMGSDAAREAARTQAGAAADANRLLWEIYQQNRSDMTPYREAGTAALGSLAGLAGQPLTAGPYTAPAGLDPSQYAFDPQQYAFQAPNQVLDPQAYAFTPPSGQDVLNEDPGYRFRIEQGMKALEGGAAARGGLLSGGTVQGAQRFGQDLASQEYGAAYNRRLGQNELRYGRAQTQNRDVYGRALSENQLGYERGLQGNQLGYARDYQANQDLYSRGRDQYALNLGTQEALRGRQWNELASLAGIGQAATSQTGQYGANYGTQAANNLTSAGAANAAGGVGAASAWNQALGGAGSAANQYMNTQLVQQQMAQQQQQNQMLMDLFRARR